MEVAYIHGRPASHPMHQKFARSVGGKFHYIDFVFRWQDKNKSIFYRIFSWFACAFFFPDKKKYDLFLIDGLHFPPVIMKMLRLIARKQKIVTHMGSHTMYFLYIHRFSKITEWVHIEALKRYDAVICEGKLTEYLLKSILGERTSPKIYTVFNGIPEEHFPTEKSFTENLNGKNILFLGHGPDKNRLWYKGLDLMISAFHLARMKDPELTFTIVGNWDADVIKELLKDLDEMTQNAIHFVGSTDDLGKYTRDASLYLHCARGEAYGLTILIAMASGVPAIVSEWTGAKEAVEQVSADFVVALDENIIAEKILWYFRLSIESKTQLSEKCRSIAKNYTEKAAIDFYKGTFEQIQKDFQLP